MSSVGEGAALRAYRERLASCHPLDRETERDLARRFQRGDRRAGERLVQACLPFVFSVALEYRRWGIPLEDIVQEGNVGLLRAAARFDLSKECRLATYAGYWIRAEIREFVVRAYRVVRIGTTKRERRALRAYRRTGETDLKRLAAMSGMQEERLEQLLPILSARESSLDFTSDGGESQGARTASSDLSPEEQCRRREFEGVRNAVASAVRALPERERLIVTERLMADDPTTLQELGLRLGVSKERVRQLEERARGKLRVCLSEYREFAEAG